MDAEQGEGLGVRYQRRRTAKLPRVLCVADSLLDCSCAAGRHLRCLRVVLGLGASCVEWKTGVKGQQLVCKEGFCLIN